MDESSLLEETGQVIYIDEDTVVLDGEEIQYIIPHAIDKDTSNLLVPQVVLPQGIEKDENDILIQEDGTAYTHYLLDTDDVQDKGHVLVQKDDFSNGNMIVDSITEEENQILQYDSQDQSVMAQVVLSEEQCHILQNFGRVILQQGSRKFLLDAEGLKEINSDLDYSTIECVFTGDTHFGNETTDTPESDKMVECEGASILPHASGADNLEELIVEDNKRSVFEFLQDRCDVMSDETEPIRLERADEIDIVEKKLDGICVENLSNVTDSDSREEDLMEMAIMNVCKQKEASQSKISGNQIKITKASDSNTDKPISDVTTPKKIVTMKKKIKDKLKPEIRGGKIVMMPEDAHTFMAEKMIKSHLMNRENSITHKPQKKIQKPKGNNSTTLNPKKISLKTLKDYKIYIGTASNGKNIYGKIIDIIKPSNNLQNKINNTTSNLDNIKIIHEETIVPAPKVQPQSTQNTSTIEDTPETRSNAFTYVVPNHTFNLNKMLLEKEKASSLLSAVKETPLNMEALLEENSENNDNTFRILNGPTVETKLPSLESLESNSKFIEPSQEEIQRISTIFTKMNKSPRLASCFMARDILIIKGTDNGDSEMFPGRVLVADSKRDEWAFEYMPELLTNLEGPSNKVNVIQNGNFLILKLIKNYSTGTTDIVIMDKVKYSEKQLQEIMDEPDSKTLKKSVICPFCKKTFYKTSCLSRHMAIHTTQKVTHKCAYCSCIFRFPSTLTRHLIEQHAGNIIE